MTSVAKVQASTLIEALRAALSAAAETHGGMEPPVAVLWTDPEGEWQSVLPALRASIPSLYTLGPYDVDKRTGPVIWLKTLIEGELPDVHTKDAPTPILYLPKVRRQTLQISSECPADLRPLVELQFRGSAWHQKNGRDMTVEAFLKQPAIGLDIGTDKLTWEALHRALPVLMSTPLGELRNRRLTADDFNRLSISDPVRSLLAWLNDREAFRFSCDEAQWGSFLDTCRSKFGVDPEAVAPQAVADRILNGDLKLEPVWTRFTESPKSFPKIYGLMAGATAVDLLRMKHDRSPKENEKGEGAIRTALKQVRGISDNEARRLIVRLQEEHQHRTTWIWADIGHAPLAGILDSLARLAKATERALNRATLPEMVAAYAAEDWQADGAALETLVRLPGGADGDLIQSAVHKLYEPWLARTAHNFQALVKADEDAYFRLVSPVEGEEGVCLVFVDGLRFDVGGILCKVIEGRGAKVSLQHRIVPLPTITSTGKPYASPAHDMFTGGDPNGEFLPSLKGSGRGYTKDELHKALTGMGVHVFDDGQLAMATNAKKGAWIEIGNIDEDGHNLNDRLMTQILREVDKIADHIMDLLQAGWRSVRVVTDHGWLFLPGSLPKVELPKSVTVRKGQRSASLQGTSETTLPTYPWHWNPMVRLVSPPGIGVFYANVSYAHGGVTLQECVVPDIRVEAMAGARGASIISVEWKRLKCRVTVDVGSSPVKVDIRRVGSFGSIADQAKDFTRSGSENLFIPDDDLEGQEADIVLLDASNTVVATRRTTIGGGR